MKYILLIVTVLFIIFDNYYSFTYDRCGYVGTGNDPKIAEVCLATSSDCCYMKWKLQNYIYYACVNKNKVREVGGYKNITLGFSRLILDENLANNVTQSISSKCSNSDDVIFTPETFSALTTKTTRNLIEETEENEPKDGAVIYYLKYVVYKALNLIFFAN
jgi:hypothetical protein